MPFTSWTAQTNVASTVAMAFDGSRPRLYSAILNVRSGAASELFAASSRPNRSRLGPQTISPALAMRIGMTAGALAGGPQPSGTLLTAGAAGQAAVPAEPPGPVDDVGAAEPPPGCAAHAATMSATARTASRAERMGVPV